MLQAQRAAIVAAGCAPPQIAALGDGADCGPGTGWDLFLWQPPRAIATETTTAVTKSDLMAGPSCHRCAQR